MPASTRLPLAAAVLVAHLALPAATPRAAGDAPPTAQAGDAAAEAAPRSPARQRRIDRRIRRGEAALADLRLTTPPEDSALRWFTEALELGPGDPRALLGIGRIVEAYLALAEDAAARGDREQARAHLANAAAVDAEHPSLPAGREHVLRLLAGRPERLELEGDALERRDGALAERLAELGTRAKQKEMLVVIRTPRDEWSRWIYQRMNAAPPAVRLRARSELGRPPGLELVPLDP
jgi:hypothetical protein